MKVFDHKAFDRLRDFGGLYVYEVRVLDEINWKIETKLRTLSENAAVRLAEEFMQSGLKANVVSYVVRFDDFLTMEIP